MWLFLPFGFYSVVQKPGETDLTVRTRVRDDLDVLRERCPALGETVVGAGTDYPYRARVSHDDFAQAMHEITAGIDYSNFKNEVADVAGYERASTYGRVWSSLYGLEDQLGT